ncbi:MAG: polysaccharide pyruvyl transferase family protein [Erysipelothrix sp.]|nr:polysaccharide pyruvyl transferase family protein [Erysipelothrix sp.]
MKIGVWAYLDNNIGDDLMIKLVANYFPEHRFLIYSDSTVVRETFSSLANVKIEPKKQLKFDLNNIDFFVSVGGSIFNNLNHRIGQINRFRRIMFLRKIVRKGIKIATIGCNLGPYTDNIGKWLTKEELKLSSLVTVRDKESFNLIKSFGCVNNYHYFNDLVFSLPLLFQNPNHTDSRGLGITVYRDMKSSEKNMIVYKTLAKIADEYVERSNLPVRLFAFDTENENDLASAHHVYNFVKFKENVRIIPYLGDYDSFLKQLALCDRIIAIRFHGSVLSTVLKIPFLPIIYSNKTENFLDDCGYSGKRVWLSDIDYHTLDIQDFVEGILSGSDLFMPEITPNSVGHFEQLQKLISGSD